MRKRRFFEGEPGCGDRTGAENGASLRSGNRARKLIRAACVGAVLCALIFGCGGDTHDGNLEFLNGGFVTGRHVSVFPDRQWHRHGQLGGSFRKSATLLVWVETAAPNDLIFSFTPDGASNRHHFAAFWDDVPLWAETNSGGGAPLKADVPASMLTRGLHRLRLERRQQDDAMDDRARAKNKFSRVRVFEQIDDRKRELEIRVNPFIASYLDFGVTGKTRVRADGWLFDGPQQMVETISLEEEAEVSFVLENKSRGQAIFRVYPGTNERLEFTVSARGRQPISFKMPPGTHQTTFEVRGFEDGAFLWGAPFLEAERPEQSGPPVIFLTLDTTRWDSVAPFSAEPRLTPNLAVFAEQAAVYPNAWATAPWTLPSHASMFTGLYPSHHEAGVTRDALPLDQLTLAEILRNRGYRTGGFIGGHMSSSVFGIAQGFSVYHDPKGWEATAESVTTAALEFIDDGASSPLFLFINYFDPHEPYAAPETYRKLTREGEAAAKVLDLPTWGPLARGEAGSWNAFLKADAPPIEAGIDFLTRAYLAEVAYMDAEIGRLFDGLRRHGIYDDALIVVVADHGEFLGEGGLWSHSYRLDPELTHVPLLIKWPGQKDGTVVADLVSHVDLFETVAAAVGAEAPPSDGRRLTFDSTAALAGRDFVLMEEHACRIHQLLGANKVADHLFGFQWLDRREVLMQDRLDCQTREVEGWQSEPCGVSWKDRADLLSEQMRAIAEIAAEYTPGDLDEDEAEKLRALGYLD